MFDSIESPTDQHSDALLYECWPASELTVDHWAAWSTIQQADPRLESPFFRPEFTQLVEATRGNVEVAVISRRSVPVGFFPFQRNGEVRGCPVGERLNDFQGPILARGVDFSPYALLDACRLSRWNYDHLLAHFATEDAGCCSCVESPYLDLSTGYDAYATQVAKQGSSILKKSRQYSRKVEREIGPIRWVWRDESEASFVLLEKWKTRVYEQIGASNIFQTPWIRTLLCELRDYVSPEFTGMLTSLYAGDELLAAHLGMQSGHVLHWWLPSYNPKFARYSPGTILLTEAAVRAQERGIERIDLGKGPESYKQRYATGAASVCEGAVDPNLFRRTLRRGWYLTRDVLQRNAWGTVPLNYYRKIRHCWTQPS